MASPGPGSLQKPPRVLGLSGPTPLARPLGRAWIRDFGEGRLGAVCGLGEAFLLAQEVFLKD
eukprot:12939023-Prorocentrum_lima.AAC.1